MEPSDTFPVVTLTVWRKDDFPQWKINSIFQVADSMRMQGKTDGERESFDVPPDLIHSRRRWRDTQAAQEYLNWIEEYQPASAIIEG